MKFHEGCTRQGHERPGSEASTWSCSVYWFNRSWSRSPDSATRGAHGGPAPRQEWPPRQLLPLSPQGPYPASSEAQPWPQQCVWSP